jgi:hypothetical protein
MAIPQVRHRGTGAEGVILRAAPSFGPNKRTAYDDVAIRRFLFSKYITNTYIKNTSTNIIDYQQSGILVLVLLIINNIPDY